DWAFIIIGLVLCVRTWRLASDARQILPPESQTVSTTRRAFVRVLFGLTAVYALGFLAFACYSRYQMSEHLLQPGVDPKREHEALVALNEGVAQFNRGDLAAAERSWQNSLRIWEELTAGRAAPSVYRINLATTLNNLGLVCL